MIQEIQGNLFEKADKTHSLAHCISRDVKMGKGIAVLFKSKFGQVDLIREQAETMNVDVAVIEEGKRFIYNLITKKNYWQKPTYESLERCLIAMREHAELCGITNIAMPRIGCGLDGLEWEKVLELLHKVLDKTKINITIYYL